jgi:phage recombination protein Bet
MTLPALYSDKQLDLIRQTVAKDCNAAEFDQFVHICRAVNLDPLRRQIYAFVFKKDDANARQMTIVTSIGGYRAIADRTGNYRPGRTEIVYDADLVDHKTNPLGISHAIATVFKYAHGEWHPVTETAYWDEYAPIVTTGEGGFEWVGTGQLYPAGHPKAGREKMRKQPIGETVAMLDPQKPTWRKMGRTMIEKCAEAKTLRRAWPDDFAGLEEESEIDRRMVDITPSEAADSAATDAKLALIGGKDAITLDWGNGSPLARIPLAKFADAVLEHANSRDLTAMELRAFWHRNLPARGEFKAKAGSDYLELQREIEAITERKEQSEATQDAAE